MAPFLTYNYINFWIQAAKHWTMIECSHKIKKNKINTKQMRSKLKSKYIYSINSYWMIWANKMQKPIDKQVLIFWAIRPNARRELFIFCLLRKLIIDFKQFNTKMIFLCVFFFLLSMLFCHLSVLIWMSLFFFCVYNLILLLNVFEFGPN